MKWQRVAGTILFCSIFAVSGFSEEYPLQYFLEKSSSKTYELSKKEKAELLNQIERVLEEAKQVQLRLSRAIQGGDPSIKYQEGKLWMSHLDEDQESIDSGTQQLKALREKTTNLVAAIRLYKSLKDLSFHFNSYNNIPFFSAYIGDAAPELALWADPVFYKLYLLPLAQAKSLETKTPTKDRKTDEKGKKQ